MSVDLEDKPAAMGIMNATAYAKKFAEDEWTWEALVGCSDEKLDVLVRRGMKEGSALTFKGRVRDAREQARLRRRRPLPTTRTSPRPRGNQPVRRGRPGSAIATPSAVRNRHRSRYAPRTGAGRVSNAYRPPPMPVTSIDGRSVYRSSGTHLRMGIGRRRGTIAVDATPERAVNC